MNQGTQFMRREFRKCLSQLIFLKRCSEIQPEQVTHSALGQL